MAGLKFVLATGEEVAAEGQDGYSLMEIAVRNDIAGIAGDCGGVLACATCHVHVAEEWAGKIGAASGIELDLLEAVEDISPRSRLCCQISWSDDLDGLVVHVPEENY